MVQAFKLHYDSWPHCRVGSEKTDFLVYFSERVCQHKTASAVEVGLAAGGVSYRDVDGI